jgi:threonine dehydrogenase-like Zn-dependent dehydrogenase
MACAMNAFHRCNVRAGDRVAVIGAGFLGLLLTRLATERGAQVVVLSRRGTSLELARQMGAHATVEMDDHQRVLDRALALGGGPFDRVVEATGHQWPLDLAGELVRTRGRLVVVGYHQDPRTVNMQLWNWRGIDVVNAHERDPAVYVRGMREAVGAVLEGRIEPWSLLTHTYPLEEVGRALEDARTRPEGFLKAVVTP